MQVYEWQQQQTGRVDRPLTQKHLSLDPYEKMTTQTALDCFSEAIEKAMEKISGTEGTEMH